MPSSRELPSATAQTNTDTTPRLSRRTALAGLLPLLPLSLMGRAAEAAPRPQAKYVFIVSFDGGKPAVMRESQMPTVMQMKQEGAGTWDAWTVVPSITLISHTSMLTGVEPDKHLIDWNDWKPEKGLVKVPTCFALAKAKGKTTAMFAGKEKFKHLIQPDTLDTSFTPPGSATIAAKEVATAAATYIKASKPNLCFVHFPDSDNAGHAIGWGSPEQKQAFADEDAALKILRDAVAAAGIEKDSVFILTADHGGHDKTHGSTSLEDMHIPWIAWGSSVRPGFEVTERVSTCDTAATALALLGVPIPKEMDGAPVLSAFK